MIEDLKEAVFTFIFYLILIRAIIGIIHLIGSFSQPAIYFDNGYEEPFIITIDDGEEEVSSLGLTIIKLKKGEHEIEIKRQNGELFESQVVNCR